MSHLTTERLSAHLDRASSDADRLAAERHLAECAECRAALAELTALDASLGRVLEHDPGEAYFAGFADRVEQRLRAEGVRGAQARGADERERPWLEWLRSPRQLAWAGAAAAVIGGAAIVLVTSREDRIAALDERLAAKGTPRTEAPAVEHAAPAPAPAGRSTRAASPEADRLQAANPGTGAGPESSPTAAAVAPSGEPGASGANARNERQKSAAPRTLARDEAAAPSAGTAPPPAPALAATERREDARVAPQAAAPARLMEVKKNANGDWVAVNPQPGVTRFAAPPAAENLPPAKAGEPVHVRKQAVATPMAGQLKDETAQTGGAAAPAPEEEGALAKAAPGEVRLCGGVFDSDQRAISGASVTLAGLGRVSFTGPDGRFCMSAPAGDHELVVNALGFLARRVQVHVGGDQANVQVALDAVSVLGDKAAIVQRGLTGRSLGSPKAGYGALSLDATAADPFAALPDSTRIAARDAQRLSAAAGVAKSAAVYELAAGRWEHVLASVPAGGAAAASARYHVAEARYGAWQAAPNAARAAAASRVLDAFLAGSPAGAQRDLALRWRAALPR